MALKYRVSTVSPVISLRRSCNLTKSSTVSQGTTVWPWFTRGARIAIDINVNDLELRTLLHNDSFSLHAVTNASVASAPQPTLRIDAIDLGEHSLILD